MTPQEINAAILLSHSTVKPEFFPHEGTMISDLYDRVVRIQGPVDTCEWCYGTGEAIFRGDYSDDTHVEQCDCRKGK